MRSEPAGGWNGRVLIGITRRDDRVAAYTTVQAVALLREHRARQ